MHKMPAMLTVPPKVSFKAQMYQAREAAILASACRLLGEKAFDLMTMDDVANAVGIAKASLYKHFGSKEALCTAAMVQMLGRVQTYLTSLPAQTPALEKLHALLRWSLEQLLGNQMPPLPGRHSGLRAVLMANQDYRAGLRALSEQIGAWITEAQAQGLIDPGLPLVVVQYTLYARACDPALCLLKEGGQYSDAEIVELVLRTCFDGLVAR